MAAPRKFDEETRHRAVRMYQERIVDHGESKLAARKHVGELLDVNPATLRNCIEKSGHVTGSVGGSPGSDHDAVLTAPRQEIAELRRERAVGHLPHMSPGAPIVSSGRDRPPLLGR